MVRMADGGIEPETAAVVTAAASVNGCCGCASEGPINHSEKRGCKPRSGYRGG